MRNNIVLLVLLFNLLALGVQAQPKNSKSGVTFDQSVKKFASALYFINNYYVDTANLAKLSENAVINTMKALDPHSSYISKEDFNSMNEPLQGNFEGIGVEFNILNDTLVVVSPITGGPSERLGIRSSDRIIKVDDENIAGVGLTNDQVFKLLRGAKGSTVKLKIFRHSVSDTIYFNVVREKIPIFSLSSNYEIAPGVVYLKLSRFAVNSMEEIKTAMAKYPKRHSLILDLRGNGGGILSTSVDLANQFFDEGKVLVYTEGQNAKKQLELSSKGGMFVTGKLIVLIDDGSASASEIVSGAIQDWDRGIIIGRRSFGKGLVQQQFPLGDGSFIRLTIARYHTPTGRVIQRPYENGATEQYYKDLFKRYTDGEIYSKDSIKFPDSLKYQTLQNKRVVYGGGGIMPDIFVPMDTSRHSKYLGKLYSKGILNQFVLTYMEHNRATLNSTYANFASFNKSFFVDEVLFEKLIAYAETEKVPRDEEGIKTSKLDIQRVLKALIARDLYTMSEYFEVVNSDDNVVEKALEVLSKWKIYEKSILGTK